MQTRQFTTRDFFGHGSIFSIKNLKLINAKGKEATFSTFYPEADLEDVEYAIVCTQDCDIAQAKVTHLNIALIEPIQRSKKENPIGFLDLEVSSLVTHFGMLNFYDDDVFKPLKQGVSSLIQNTNAHFLFLEMANSCYFVNLTKIFPIKFKHLEKLQSQVEFQLEGSFKHLLGWKLANLFGRVGVEDYDDSTRKKVETKIFEEVFKSLRKDWPANSHKLEVDQLKKLKSVLRKLEEREKAGKDVAKNREQIFSLLQEFNVLKSD